MTFSIIILIILALIYLLITLVIVIFFLSTFQMIFYTRVPFVPVPKEVLPYIIQALKLKEGSVFYDLGCGDARVLVAAARASTSESSKLSKSSKASKASEASEASKASKASWVSEASKSKGRFSDDVTMAMAKLVGIERVWLPLVLAKLKVWRNKKGQQIKIYSQDFFETDLREATHIFLYLFPKIMDELLPKFERELKPGTRVISASFKFSNKKEKEIINLNRKENQLARELYIYEF